MVDSLTSNLLSILDKHAPLKTSTIHRTPAPWMNVEIRDLRRRREAARRRHRRTGHPEDYNSYKRLRNSAQSAIRRARCQHIHNALSTVPDLKSKWRILRNLSLVQSTNSPSDYPAAPDQFNSHFIYSSFHDGPVPATRLPSFSPFVPDKFFFSHITPEDIVKAVLSIKTNAIGFDGIPAKFLKLCLPFLLPILYHIYNFSLQNSVFPSQWKIALVKPLNKVPNPSSLNDFRPISILSILSKPLEKLVQSQMTSFLNNSGLLNPLQSGFRFGHSTQSALVKITTDLYSAIDNHMVTILILLDFSKAFDNVDHSLFLFKLDRLSFSKSSILWFHSFLSKRSQIVSIPHKPHSNPLPIVAGVPQGSNVSPPSFCVYINDLPTCIKYCSFHLYADDCQIYLSFYPANLQSAITCIQEDLNNISAWAVSNKLKLNADKTKAIVIGSPSLISALPPIPPLTLDQTPISFCTTARNLGVTFDQTLSWKSHISQISRRCFSTLHQFRRNFRLLPQETRKLLVSSLIFPHFDYGCVVYGGIAGELEDKLKRLMNSFIRFVFGSPRDSRVTCLYSELKWLYPSYRRQYFLGVFLYHIISSQSPSYLYHLLQFKSDIRSRNTRSRPSDLYPPSHRTSAFDRSFIIRSSILWNSLPPNIRRASSLLTFKSLLFKHLFSLQNS